MCPHHGSCVDRTDGSSGTLKRKCRKGISVNQPSVEGALRRVKWWYLSGTTKGGGAAAVPRNRLSVYIVIVLLDESKDLI